MQWIIIGIVIISCIILKSVYDKFSIKKKIMRKLLRNWGCLSEEEISYERQQTIASFYESKKEPEKDIDEITWHDLDLETLFYEINQTGSAMGEEYLYSVLHKPLPGGEEYERRQELIHLYEEREDIRLTVGRIFMETGKLKKISVYEYISYLDTCPKGNTWISILCILGFFAALLVTIFGGLSGLALIFISVGINMMVYYREKEKVGKYYDVLLYLLRVFYGARKFTKCEIPELSKYCEEISEVLKSFRGFRSGAFLINSTLDGGSFFDIIMDYVRMLFHVDLIKFNQMVTMIRNKREPLTELFKTLGILDAMYAVASYRVYLGTDNYCEPEFTTDNIGMEVEGLFHPLVENPVKADFSEINSVLLTGSNASGKSTFLKAVAINALLSQTICTSMSKYYKAPRYKIFSSMALSDNIFENESYFIVEIKSLKRILDKIDDTTPMLIFIDEVLRGTNTLERIAASSRILSELAAKNTMCFAATHDIELTYILENKYSNYHFTEDVIDNTVVFEYILHKGRATSRNAIKLLTMLGYPKEIVSQAETSVEEYLRDGQWKIFE